MLDSIFGMFKGKGGQPAEEQALPPHVKGVAFEDGPCLGCVARVVLAAVDTFRQMDGIVCAAGVKEIMPEGVIAEFWTYIGDNRIEIERILVHEYALQEAMKVLPASRSLFGASSTGREKEEEIVIGAAELVLSKFLHHGIFHHHGKEADWTHTFLLLPRHPGFQRDRHQDSIDMLEKVIASWDRKTPFRAHKLAALDEFDRLASEAAEKSDKE